MLQLAAVEAGYGAVRVLRDVSLTAAAGEITCIMGRNGAGKSTLVQVIMGLVRADAGTVTLDGEPLHTLPAHLVARRGVGYVPQGRRLFGPLTVAETLAVGLMTRPHPPGLRDRVLDLFPRLRDRLDQVSSTLSGGEQQMLAIARALCLQPRVLLLDEPGEGLQPSMLVLIRDVVARLKSEGVAVLLVEHRVEAVLQIADQVVFMDQGRVAAAVAARDLHPQSAEIRQYLGV